LRRRRAGCGDLGPFDVGARAEARLEVQMPAELDARAQIGARVDVVEAYKTVAPAGLAERAAEILGRGPDWITFTSSSTVENLVGILGAEALRHTKTASIGPITSATLRTHGIGVATEAVPHTVQGVVDAILRTAII